MGLLEILKGINTEEELGDREQKHDTEEDSESLSVFPLTRDILRGLTEHGLNSGSSIDC
jgi:hypothetical protein